MDRPTRRPGDIIIDRHMLNATPEEREQAHARLRRFVAALMHIAVRLEKEKQEQRDSAKHAGAI